MRSRSSGYAGPADPLSEVLQDLRIKGIAYGRCALSTPWSLRFDPQGPARFHFVASGPVWLCAPDGAWSELSPGDVLLLPHGKGHRLADKPRRSSTSIDDVPRKRMGREVFDVRFGGSGPSALLFCGSVELGEPNLHPLLSMMPEVLRVSGAGSRDPHLERLLQTMADEVEHRRIGGATVLARLAEAVVARVLRMWVDERHHDARGWLAAIRDPRIGRALGAIHAQPGHRWTLERLARTARTSRTVFAQRFSALVGMPPAQYLARWRMHVARGWLREDRATVADVAARLGYESEPAFSRAFKRATGVPPSALRVRVVPRSAAR
jgi:AraC-like DNA-binding protein